jgi:hypothetical protein
MSGRNKDFVDERVKNPGPGTYSNVNPTIIKEQSPAYTMRSRTNVPSDSSKIPGPGNYSPEKVCLDYMPAHSFGIRHSPWADHF